MKIVKRNKSGRFVKGSGSPRFGIFKSRLTKECKACKKVYNTYHKLSRTCSSKCKGVFRSFWRGNRNDYRNIHHKISKILGTPMLCKICKSKDKKRYEWANLSGDYQNPQDYIRLCHSCHVAFDYRNILKR